MKQVSKFSKKIAPIFISLFALMSIVFTPMALAQATGTGGSSGSGTGTGTGTGGSTTVTGLDAKKQVCDGLDATGTTDCGGGTGMDVQSLIRSIINILSVVVGAVSVIMIIIGGFRYVISNGDSNSVSGAKNTILYAIIGLIVVLFAQVIVRFVIDNATKPAPAAPPASTTP